MGQVAGQEAGQKAVKCFLLTQKVVSVQGGKSVSVFLRVALIEAADRKLYTLPPAHHGSAFQERQSRAAREDGACGQRSEVREPVVLRYPLPYPHDSPLPPLVPQQPAELQYGNPYCDQDTRGA